LDYSKPISIPAGGNPTHPRPEFSVTASSSKSFPKKERRLWDSAKSRSFDLGFEGPKKDRYYWGTVSQKAVRAAAEVGAQIAITIYGPMRVPKPKKKRVAAAK
jgi:hypothetical protein